MVAILAEVFTVRSMLSRFGLAEPGLTMSLFVVNLATWLPFLIAVDWLQLRFDAKAVPAFVLLELGVIAAEVFLIRMTTRGACKRLEIGALTFKRSLGVSLLGNTVSIAVSLTIPLGIIVLVR